MVEVIFWIMINELIKKSTKPFLKWAGGKRQLLDEIMKCVLDAGEFKSFHEPFVGGGALFFHLAGNGYLNHKLKYLSDINTNLIDAYWGLQNDVEGVIICLKKHSEFHNNDYYYRVRSEIPEGLIERAARIIYLNKTCYNGLYRENSQGKFNVPIGRYKKPNICDETILRNCALSLQGANIAAHEFEKIIEYVSCGDFVYFDPPYVPISNTASFTTYSKNGFGINDQKRLAFIFRELDKRGVKVLLSNSMTEIVGELYKGFKINVVYAKRFVNSRSDCRGTISETLICNY